MLLHKILLRLSRDALLCTVQTPSGRQKRLGLERCLTGVREGLGSVPSTLVRPFTTDPNPSSRGSETISWSLWAAAVMSSLPDGGAGLYM